jgi:hypothetical protein
MAPQDRELPCRIFFSASHVPWKACGSSETSGQQERRQQTRPWSWSWWNGGSPDQIRSPVHPTPTEHPSRSPPLGGWVVGALGDAVLWRHLLSPGHMTSPVPVHLVCAPGFRRDGTDGGVRWWWSVPRNMHVATHTHPSVRRGQYGASERFWKGGLARRRGVDLEC